MKKLFINIILLSLILFTNTSCKNDEIDKNRNPNIIIILLDDAGYIDFGFMGSKDLETPYIDSLSKSGVVFTDAHVTATVCAPSRAGIMLGRYQQRFGFEANHTGDENSGDIGLPDNQNTLADILKSKGYRTTAIGKWHLGATQSDQPNQRGFDDFYGFLGGGRSYFPIEKPTKEQMLQHNGKRVKFDGYLTDALGDYSVSYVEENKDDPFFMYLAFNAVHTPMHAKKEHLEKYKNHKRKELAAMTWSVDENIGKLTQKLKELDLFDNTLIFFLSDNGGATNNQSDNGRLKGWKGNKFEGGQRVPFILSWPDQVKGSRKFEGLTSSLDIFSTAIEVASVGTKVEIETDGVNLIPYLKDIKHGNPHNALFWKKLDESAIRIGKHKLIQLDSYGYVLYDLENDLSETKDLSSSKYEIAKSLLINLSSWKEDMISPLWIEDNKWMEVTKHIHQQLMKNKEVLYQDPKEMKFYKTKQQNNSAP